jgi:hypothetical protein
MTPNRFLLLVPGTGDDPVTSCFSDTRPLPEIPRPIAPERHKARGAMFGNAGL